MGSQRPPHASFAAGFCAAGLAGMAYCHIKDVGMKFDEHVYYMAVLFCCNIAASIALIPLVLYAPRLPERTARMVWAAACGLAALTIVGFAWSRTIGFPEMEDHVGEWDTLGITSVVFEVLVVTVSAAMLRRLPHQAQRGPRQRSNRLLVRDGALIPRSARPSTNDRQPR